VANVHNHGFTLFKHPDHSEGADGFQDSSGELLICGFIFFVAAKGCAV